MGSAGGDALARLRATQNRDGGWGAWQEMPSQTEATALALLALAPDADAARARAVAWLAETQRPDGSWPLTAEVPEGSWATSLAALALARVDGPPEVALRGARWLLAQEVGRTPWLRSLLERVFPDRRAIQQEGTLRGWPWTAGHFSWVEPTAYALMALKTWRTALQDPRLASRIQEAERMVYDRMCTGGGWNYGNSVVLGEELWPYPDLTALALIALQDRAGDEANQQSLRALPAMLDTHASGLALGWSILCLELYGRDPGDLPARLERTFRARGVLGETRSLALVALALGNGAERLRFAG